MRIRGKILLLVCAIALTPAGITAWMDIRLLRSLSDDLTRRTANAMEQQALATMDRVAGDYAGLLDREARRIRTLVALQADTAERLLRQSRVSAAAGDDAVFFDDDFDANEAALGLVYRGDGDSVPVSLEHQVFRLAPGLSDSAVPNDVAALAPMTGFYRQVRDPDDAVIKWQYVVLENGLSATYPGHGGYPEPFDPRARPWYQAQKAAPGFRWNGPHIDASTRSVVMNATQPLSDGSGKFIGVTGIDVDLMSTFDLLKLPDHLAAGSEVLQVAGVFPPAADQARMVVLARRSEPENDRDWTTVPAPESFALDDDEATREITTAMFEERDGLTRAVYHGRDHFVLYRGFGESRAYIVMMVPVEYATAAAIDAARYAATATAGHISSLLLMLVFTTVVLVIIALVSSYRFTRPLRTLTEAVGRLTRGEFDARVDIATHDELQTLGDAFNAMIPRLADHAYVSESLNVAREVQQQLLPPHPPEVAGYDIAGVSIYSDQTGGDYFDYLPLDAPGRERFGIAVADVSGHGIGPALLMATTRALLHGGQGRGLGLAGLTSHVNAQLADDVNRGHFVTLFILAVDAHTREVEWVSAGHDPALLFRAADASITELAAMDIPLGIMANWNYTDPGSGELERGDIVLIGTDGIWEAADTGGGRFGKQRIRDYLAAHATDPAEAVCNGLITEIEAFRGGRTQSDDITVVVVKRTGP